MKERTWMVKSSSIDERVVDIEETRGFFSPLPPLFTVASYSEEQDEPMEWEADLLKGGRQPVKGKERRKGDHGLKTPEYDSIVLEVGVPFVNRRLDQRKKGILRERMSVISRIV
jgi:hypothetical protein